MQIRGENNQAHLHFITMSYADVRRGKPFKTLTEWPRNKANHHLGREIPGIPRQANETSLKVYRMVVAPKQSTCA